MVTYDAGPRGNSDRWSDCGCQEGPQRTGVLGTKGHCSHWAGSRQWGRKDGARMRGCPSLPLEMHNEALGISEPGMSWAWGPPKVDSTGS